jgi:plasmid maintenance system antidote protein VapI
MMITAADLRAKIAREQVAIYQIAARIELHPARLSLILNERAKFSQELAQRILDAIEELSCAAK